MELLKDQQMGPSPHELGSGSLLTRMWERLWTLSQRHVVTTRYPYERTWSVATYLSPISVRSRIALV
jgi:hypothetical protein